MLTFKDGFLTFKNDNLVQSSHFLLKYNCTETSQNTGDVVHGVGVTSIHVVTSKVSMSGVNVMNMLQTTHLNLLYFSSGANVMNMLQTTHLDLLYFSFRWFPLNSFHYQYNDYYHFYGLLVCHIFEILSFVYHTFDVSGFMT